MWKRKTGCNADMKSFVLTCMMSTTRIYCRERKQSSVVTRNDCRSSKSYLQTSHFLLRSNSSFIMFLLPFPSDLLNFLSHHRVIHIISLYWCLVWNPFRSKLAAIRTYAFILVLSLVVLAKNIQLSITNTNNDKTCFASYIELSYYIKSKLEI